MDRLKVSSALNTDAKQLNEIFKRFNAEQIKEADEDTDKYKEIESFFNNQKNKIKQDTATFCFLDFCEQRIPTDNEIEFLTEIAYCNSDITTIPMVGHFSDSKDSPIAYQDYKKYIEKAIESIEQLNHKPIMGIVPRLSRKNILDLLNFYQSKGITAYALDLEGSNPISARMSIFKVLKAMNKIKILEKSYIHGHNVGMRVNKTTDIIPAKDILGFGLGLDSIGEKRTEFKPNRVFLTFIKTNPLNKFRLFNKKDYGYWKSISASDLEKVYPSDSSVPITAFKSAIKNASHFNYIQKIFNCEQLAIESHKVKQVITEDSKSILDYIKKKKSVVPDDIKVIEAGQKSIE